MSDLIAVTYKGGFDEVHVFCPATGDTRTVARDETIQVLPVTADGLSEADWVKKAAPKKKTTTKKAD